VTVYNPEQFLETVVRTLKEYTEEAFHQSVVDDQLNYVGEKVYEVEMEFPATDRISKSVPLEKTLIHFEIDDIEDRIIGLGDQVYNLNFDIQTGLIQPQSAAEHRIDFDVGVWTSDRAGGITSRLRAYQILRNLFFGSVAIEKLRTRSVSYDPDDGGVDGIIDIWSFSGGRFITEVINDINVYRIAGCSLILRVYSRTPKDIEIQTIDDIVQDPELILEDNLVIP
jgi:hypothetical protein